MKIMSTTFRVMTCAAFVLALSALAQAQATRTWVSGVGDDVNPCSRTAPCKTFAGAISKTAAGGEIDALDPGGFGAVTITKSIILDGAGTMASILHSGTNGVNVNDSATATPNTIKVTLRNLSINGAGTTLGINGVNATSGAELSVESCAIANTSNAGINISTGNTSPGFKAFIRDTVVRNTVDGLNSTSSSASGFVRVGIENSAFIRNSNGIHARSQSRVVASRSDFSLNSSRGVFVESLTAGQFAVARVWNSQVANNGTNGVQSGNAGNGGSSIVEIGLNQINNNNQGVLISTGGAVETFTNNSIRGNNTDGCVGCSGVGPGN